MNYEEAVNYLYSRAKFGWKLGLENTTALLSKLGNPHTKFDSVHVAGSSGKGSTSAIIESILRTQGYRTGLYTSPHLVSFGERVRVKGCMIPEDRVREFVSFAKPFIESSGCTFFESITAMGFWHFAESEVDIAVVETGLGGRLDATNVIYPLLSVITSISIEHAKHLGNTLEEITFEKAGIIKENGRAMAGFIDGSALSVIEDISSKMNASLDKVTESVEASILRLSDKGTSFSYNSSGWQFPEIFTPLVGKHQFENSITAVRAVEVLRDAGVKAEPDSVISGLANVSWPGRLQVIGRDPLVLLDGAHSPAKVGSLRKALEDIFSFRRLILVIGIMSDKDYPAIVSILAPLADFVITTEAKMKRSLDAEQLAEEFRTRVRQTTVEKSTLRAYEMAREIAEPDDLICVTGSIFVVGEIMEGLGIDPWETESGIKETRVGGLP